MDQHPHYSRGSLLDLVIFLMIVGVLGALLAPWVPASLDNGLAFALAISVVVILSVLVILLPRSGKG